MKTIILKNCSYNIEEDQYLYLHLCSTPVEVCEKHNNQFDWKKTYVFMWDDHEYDEGKKTWVEYLNPRPIDRICDVIRNLFEWDDEEFDHFKSQVNSMSANQTLKYDLETYMFI